MLMCQVCIIHSNSQYVIIGIMYSLPDGMFTGGFIPYNWSDASWWTVQVSWQVQVTQVYVSVICIHKYFFGPYLSNLCQHDIRK